MLKRFFSSSTVALIVAGAASAQVIAAPADDARLVLTASNTPANQLLVYNSFGTLLTTVPTQGQGGVSGNAGGIAARRDRAAVVNFGSGNVSIFARDPDSARFHLEQLIPAVASPVSVAFGAEHLYILSTTHVESHEIGRDGVQSSPDGMAALLKADGSAAQVGVVDQQLVISEKSNVIETVNLDVDGAVKGTAMLVANIPANVNAPFGLATRGNNAYVSIAHADEISLVRNNEVLTVTGSGTQHAPCWLALDGPFLFSANTPSKSVSRYVVYGQHIIQDAAVAAQFNGGPTDIAYRDGLAAVVDANGTVSHVSVFKVDEDGNLTLRGTAIIAGIATNGVAIVRQDEELDY